MNSVPHCINDNTASIVCLTKDCKFNPFVCEDSICECSDLHAKCATKMEWLKLKSAVKLNKPQINSELEEYLKEVDAKFNRLIKDLNEAYAIFLQFRRQAVENPQYAQLEAFLDNDNYTLLTGDYLYSVKSAFQQEPIEFRQLNHISNESHSLIDQLYKCISVTNLRWSETLKSPTIQLINNSVRQTKRHGMKTDTVAMMEPVLRSHKIYNWSVKIKSERALVGVCLKNIVQTNSFGILLERTTHGGYLITGGGYSYSHCEQQWNKTKVTFEKDCVVHCVYNGLLGKLSFEIEDPGNEDTARYEMKVNHHQDLHACVYLWNEGAAELI